ncbi:hypothetical protein Tco_0723804 [Tanacetum coccineum]
MIKCCWFKLQQVVKLYTEEEIAFVAVDPGLPDIHTLKCHHPSNAAYQGRMISDAYASVGDELNSAKITSLWPEFFDYELDRYKEEVQDLERNEKVGKQFFRINMEQYAEIKLGSQKPKLYDGNTILKMDTIVIPDSDETLMLCGRVVPNLLLNETKIPMVVKH